MTKKALIILFASIGGAIVVGGTTTAIVVSNSTTYVDDPTADTTNFVYNGSEQTYKLQESDLYTITGNKKTDAGEYSVTVSLNKKNKYAWKSTKKSDDLIFNFTIDKKGVLEPSAGTSLFEYTGSEVTYTVTNEDSSFYTVTNNKATNAGTYNAKVSLNDAKNYKWKNSNKSDDLTLPFTISQKDVSSLIAIDDIDDMEYTGEHINPNVTLKTAIPEYEIIYGENVNVGKGTVTITAKGNFTGSKTFEFNIVTKKITIPTPTTTEYTYTGSEIVHNIPESGYYDILNNKAINAGNYTATLSLKDKTNTTWSDGTTEDKEYNFTINPITILETNVQNINNVTYTGQELTPEVKITSGNYVLIKDTDYTLSYSNNKNAGEATVTITGKGNYTGTVNKTFTINKKTPNITAPTPKENLRQTGQPLELITAGSTSDGTLEYSLDNVTYSTDIPTGTAYGEYTIYYKVTGNDNIEDVSESHFTVTIAKPYATYSQLPTGEQGLEYDGTDQVLVVAGSSDYGTILYSLSEDSGFDADTGSIVGNDAGTYTVWYYIQSTNNDYDDSEKASLEVTISPKKADTYTSSPEAKDDLVYDGDSHNLVEEGSSNEGTVLYSLDENGEFTSTIPTGINAGTYTVYYKIKATSTNYTDSDVSHVDVKIDPCNISVVTIGSVQKYDYTGSQITPDVVVLYNDNTLVKDTDYTVSYANNTNAGTATITITGKGNFTETKGTTFTINKIAPVYNAPTARQNLVYTGEELPLINAGSSEHGTVYYKLNDGEYTDDITDIVGTIAGTYTIYHKLTGDQNHNDVPEASFTVTIAPKEIAIPTSLDSVNYNGTAQSPEIDSNKEYKLNSEYSKTNASTYNDVVIVLKDTKNTKWENSNETTATTSWTINQIPFDSQYVVLASAATYTGDDFIPDIIVTINGTKLYDNTVLPLVNDGCTIYYTTQADTTTHVTPKDVGNYYVFIENNNFTTKYQGPLTITYDSIPINSCTISSISDQTYTGSAITPEFTVTLGTHTLALNTEYTYTITNNIDAGTATITVTGQGNYTGSKTGTFKIVPRPIDGNDITVADIDAVTYDTNAHTPIVVVTYNSTPLTLGDDYTVSYDDNTDAGTATITIAGKGNFGGSRDVYFTINKKNISEIDIPAIDDQTYTGFAITPVPTIELGGNALSSANYDLVYASNINVGTATITITGKNNCSGTKQVTFAIVKKDLGDNDVVVADIDAVTFNNENQEPEVTITYGSYTLIANTDYTVSYANNTNAGTATITITAAGDNFKNSTTKEFTINRKSIASLEIAPIANQKYAGSAIEPAVVIKDFNDTYTLIVDTDFTATYSNNDGVGTATITITGINNYTGENSTTFRIYLYDIENCAIADIDDQTYTGSAIEPTLIVTNGTTPLVLNTDYTVEFTNNINASNRGNNANSASVTVTGKGEYSGTKSTTFIILPKSMTSSDIEATVTGYVFNPTDTILKPTIAVRDTARSAYLVSSTDYGYQFVGTDTSTDAGNKTVRISGYGNYTGYTDEDFTITPLSLSTATISNIDEQAYTGSAVQPTEFTVTLSGRELINGVDYTVTYNNNINAGTHAQVIVTGIGNYTGSAVKEFTIVVVIITYDITYDLPNLAGITNPNATTTQVTSDVLPYELEDLVIPITTGYEFDGWYINNIKLSKNTNDKYQIPVNPYNVEKTITIEARVKTITYHVIYHNTDNVTTQLPEINYNVESNNINLPTSTDVTMDGATFDGWFTDSNCTAGNEITSITSGTIGNTDIYAKWTYTTFNITYNNVTGATNTNPATYNVSSTVTFVNASKKYYTFGGWYTDNNTFISNTEDLTGDLVLYAKWTAINYTITFDYGINTTMYTVTNSNATTTNTTKTYTVETPTIVLDDASATQHKFDGWYASKSNDVYSNPITQITTSSPDDITIYAKFTLLPTDITNYLNDVKQSNEAQHGNVTSNILNKEVGETVTITVTVAGGYTLDGLYSVVNNVETKLTLTNNQYSFTLTDSEIEYRVKYYSYTLTYVSDDGNRGYVTGTPVTGSIVRSGSSATLVAHTYEGYTFIGWFKNSETTPASTNTSYNYTMESANVTFTAKWIKVTVVSNNNSYGTVSSLDSTYVVGDEVQITATPSTDMIFIGWTGTYVDNEHKYDNPLTITMPNEDTTITATFIENNVEIVDRLIEASNDGNTYTFEYVANNNINSSYDVSVSGNQLTYTMSPNANFVFAGWYDKAASDKQQLSATYTYTLTAPETSTTVYIYALWVRPISVNKNYNEVSLTVSSSFGLASNGIRFTASSTDEDYTWDGWYNSDALNTRIGTSTTLSLSYADTYQKLITEANDFNGLPSYTAKWTLSGITVVSADDNMGSVSKKKVGTVYYTITATPKAGYKFLYWTNDEHNTAEDNFSTDATVSNVPEPVTSETYVAHFSTRNDIKYTINVQKQNYNDNDYTETETPIKGGSTGGYVFISKPTDPTGYVFKEAKIGEDVVYAETSGDNSGKYRLDIKNDGSAAIDFYYDLLTVNVTYHKNDGTTTQNQASTPVKYNPTSGHYDLMTGIKWYTDKYLTDPDTTDPDDNSITFVDSDATVWACYGNNNNLNGNNTNTGKFENTVINDTYYWVKYKGTVAGATIVIPDYIDDLPVKKVNVDNLYGVAYTSLTMPSTLEFIEYGSYNSNPISWVILKDSDDSGKTKYKLLSESVIDSATYSATETILSTLTTNIGLTFTLLSRDDISNSEYNNSYFATSTNWWTNKKYGTKYHYIVDTNGVANTKKEDTETIGVRPTIELSL